MAAQHYNSCPFMAMKSTKLKHFNLDDKKKKGGNISPVLFIFLLYKKNLHDKKKGEYLSLPVLFTPIIKKMEKVATHPTSRCPTVFPSGIFFFFSCSPLHLTGTTFFYYKKKKCTPSLLLVLFIPKKRGGTIYCRLTPYYLIFFPSRFPILFAASRAPLKYICTASAAQGKTPQSETSKIFFFTK